MKQTILGSGSALSDALARVLHKYSDGVRLVSRRPKQVTGDEELVQADLLEQDSVDQALKGSEIAYLTIGLEYDANEWLQKWPIVMHNVIQACQKHNVKLVFLDNVYMYGKVEGMMDENTPYNPCSKKGEAREKVATMLQDAMAQGKIEAIIARSADFYGYGAEKTFVMPMVFDKIKSGKSALWLVNAKVPHSLTYIPDIAEALAILGNDASAYAQVWHLPTDLEAPTGEEFIKTVAEAYGVEMKYSVLPQWLLKVLGVFSPMIRETNEMLYQFERPYLFDSTKFQNKYFKATPYKEAIRRIIKEEYAT